MGMGKLTLARLSKHITALVTFHRCEATLAAPNRTP